jgi:hypothetical protein
MLEHPEGTPFNGLHRHEGDASRRMKIEDSRNVGVVEPSEHTRLALKALTTDVMTPATGAEHLQGHLTVKNLVLC